MQIEAGLGNPFIAGSFPRLEYVLKGIKHTPSAQARPPRLPITPPILRGLKSAWAAQAANPDYILLALGGMLLGIFWIFEGGRVCSHVKPVI